MAHGRGELQIISKVTKFKENRTPEDNKTIQAIVSVPILVLSVHLW